MILYYFLIQSFICVHFKLFLFFSKFYSKKEKSGGKAGKLCFFENTHVCVCVCARLCTFLIVCVS